MGELTTSATPYEGMLSTSSFQSEIESGMWLSDPNIDRLNPEPTRFLDLPSDPTETDSLLSTHLPLVSKDYPLPPTIFGTEIAISWNKSMAGLIPYAEQANLNWVRYNGLLWSEIESEQGVRDWTKAAQFEENLADLSTAGLTTIVIVRSTPAWAQKFPGVFCGQIHENHLDEFADFMAEVVLRYSAPPYNVTYWEIWNEPDVDPSQVGPNSIYGCLGDKNDAYFGGGDYAKMLKHIYPAMKLANPDVQVILGGLLLDCDPSIADCPSALFTEGILLNGGGSYFDIVSFHGYAYYWWVPGGGDWDLSHPKWDHRGGILLGQVDFLRELLNSYGLQKPIIAGETSLICHEINPNCPNENFYDDQANYAIRLFTRSWAHGLMGTIWYSLNGPNWRDCGLLNGSTPKPVYNAVQFLSTLLDGAVYEKQLSSGDLEGYQFNFAATEYQVYWTNYMTSTAQLALPANTSVVYDKFGNDITPVDPFITINFQPVIIQVGDEE